MAKVKNIPFGKLFNVWVIVIYKPSNLSDVCSNKQNMTDQK